MRLAVPAILGAIVLVAGVFAFIPVQDASTVHTTIEADLKVGSVDVDSIADDTITEAKIADDAIDEEHIEDDAIRARHIQADAIGESELAADSITSSELETSAITEITDSAYGSQVIMEFSTDLNGDDLVATSTEDFVVCVTADNPTVGDLDVTVEDEAGNTINFDVSAGHSADVGCFGGDAEDTVTISGGANLDAFATLITTEDATASIT